MRNKAFVLEFVLAAALFAAMPSSATSIPFCKDYGTASPRPDPVGAGVIEVVAPVSAEVTFPVEGRMLVGVNYWGSKAGIRMWRGDGERGILSIRENDGCVFEVAKEE